MVLIKDMPMPKTCGQCRLKDYAQAICIPKGRKISRYACNFDYPKPEWCPLTEVEAYGPVGTLYKEK